MYDKKCDVIHDLYPTFCHKLSHFLKPPPFPGAWTYFMNVLLFVTSYLLPNTLVEASWSTSQLS